LSVLSFKEFVATKKMFKKVFTKAPSGAFLVFVNGVLEHHSFRNNQIFTEV
jgi:hypothetical protein